MKRTLVAAPMVALNAGLSVAMAPAISTTEDTSSRPAISTAIREPVAQKAGVVTVRDEGETPEAVSLAATASATLSAVSTSWNQGIEDGRLYAEAAPTPRG